MDKNTIIGFILILAVLVGFSYLNRPSQEELEAQKRRQDSIAWVQQQQMEEIAQSVAAGKSPAKTEEGEELPDSVRYSQLQDRYGSFSVSAQGTEREVTLENSLVKINLNTKGGHIHSVLLKEYTNYEHEPLYLFEGDTESAFGMTLITANNRVFKTNDFYFQVVRETEQQAVLRLSAGDDKYLDFVYTIHPDDYMVDFDVVPHNLQDELSPAMHTLDIQWMQKIRQNEKGRKFEERYARLTYKFLSGDLEEMRESKDDTHSASNKLKWIGYKDQFFSSVLISKNHFETARLDSKYLTAGKYMKEYNTSTGVPFNRMNGDPVGFSFYFGPNDYTLLKNYDKQKFEGQNLELERLVPLGWSLFRFVNKWLIIPIFDRLTAWGVGLGLAIFLLTLIIKMILFPLTYKSFMSSAKMRVLKPQIEVITSKYKGQDNALIRQQKTMELYKQVGVSPMAGCLPMLLQMPFLLALFWFFPSAIELRQQSFLWATDLSTYDSLIHWDTYIPFISKYLGNHISLFCLLMSVATILNTKYTMDQQNTGQEQMPGMKMMMYFMPVMMFFFLNSYPAGLNYYYLISTLITVLQTIVFRFFINEEQLLAKLEANKSKVKPAKKKSGFMARLEEMQRQQQALLKEQQKKRQRK
ncbi:MAG: membrane protein insertase YidC [Dysgonamonadaceae bacterium]|jgi:YidC/Oxa1 family membrane protein insertase|nr:membrane protein insertase YidC [Dysgonamonadaceae bacterium]